MCFRPVYLLILLQTINVLGQIAHNKLNIDLDQNVGENDLLRDSAEKYMETSAEFPALINVDNSRNDVMNLSSLPYDSDDYQSLLSDEHSNYYRRQKRESKVMRQTDGMAGPGLYGPKIRERPDHYHYPPLFKEIEKTILPPAGRKSVILPEHMNPGVIFRVRMSDAILRIKQRMYEDPETHTRADIMYTTLIRKVVTDEITKFHNLLLMYKTDRTVKEHSGECGGRIYKFISLMTIKVHIYCLFDSLWIDGIPYIIGDEYSVTPVDFPSMLQCDAAECNSVNFIYSIPLPINEYAEEELQQFITT